MGIEFYPPSLASLVLGVEQAGILQQNGFSKTNGDILLNTGRQILRNSRDKNRICRGYEVIKYYVDNITTEI